MNRNIVIVMAGGFLVAVLVAMIVQATLSGGSKKEVKNEATTSILVALKPIKTGDSVTEVNAKWQTWPKSGVFEGAFVKEGNKKISEVAKSRVKRDIAIGEPITKSALVPDKVNFLSASMEPGMRAVAIKVKASNVVAGFVAPGDRVDVLLTYKAKISIPGATGEMAQTVIKENITSKATETILENVRVLATDQSPKRNEEKIKVPKTVTLEVDQKGAEALSLAEAVGTISLSLRSLGDVAVNDKPRPAMSDARLTRLYREIAEEIERKQGTGQGGNIVRVYSGGYVNEVKVVP